MIVSDECAVIFISRDFCKFCIDELQIYAESFSCNCLSIIHMKNSLVCQIECLILSLLKKFIFFCLCRKKFVFPMRCKTLYQKFQIICPVDSPRKILSFWWIICAAKIIFHHCWLLYHIVCKVFYVWLSSYFSLFPTMLLLRLAIMKK